MFTLLRNVAKGSECVYDLIEGPPVEMDPGPPLYRSIYSRKVRQDADYAKTGCWRTMGLSNSCKCPPQNYLKKNARVPISIRPPAVPRVRIVSEGCPSEGNTGVCGVSSPQTDCNSGQAECPPSQECCPSGQRPCRPTRLCCCLGLEGKPAVPCRAPLCIIPRGKKNFIRSNVVNAIRQVPRKPAMRFVDDPKGNTKDWNTAGLARKYVNSPTFGKVPCYIEEIKAELCERDLAAKYAAEGSGREMASQCRALEPVERDALLNGLRANWEDKFAEFQAMPLNIDTPMKVAKKSELESVLSDLERDIQMIDRHEFVFVGDTNRSFYM